MRPIKLIRNFGNQLGLAWWAKIETNNPTATYWYGPFLTKNSLTEEGSNNIKHSLMRCKKTEPLTIY